MPRTCTICTHANRPEIDRLVVSGEPNQRIATRFSLTESSVRRHRATHLPKSLVKAEAAKEVVEADNLLSEVRQVQSRAAKILDQAEQILEKALAANDPRLALSAIKAAAPALRELRNFLSLKGELTHELGDERDPGLRVIVMMPNPVPVGTMAELYPNRALPDPSVIDAEVIPPEPPEPPTAH